jgi:predicted TIM-barrel fold metal-dependent hydrolase
VTLRGYDFHVHLPTPDWLDGSMAGYVEAAEAYFRGKVERQSLAQLAQRYEGLGLKAVLLAWDAETATGRPRVPNETVASAVRQFPDAFCGLGSVDPRKGQSAVDEVAQIAGLGLRGVKFHPSLQRQRLSVLRARALPGRAGRAGPPGRRDQQAAAGQRRPGAARRLRRGLVS